MRRASNNESLDPARPQIGKAGANVEDQDAHGILVGYLLVVTLWPHMNTLRANFHKSGILQSDFLSGNANRSR
jgi:hypothetical protein